MIVLVGFMGAGKSTVGRLVAEYAGMPFVDTDVLVEARAARTIPEIFAQGGEIAFRDLEHAVVAEVLAGPEAVVALGGGALSDPAVLTALDWATVAHLDVGVAEALRRLNGDRPRPMLDRDEPSRLAAARRPIYEAAVARARRGFRVETEGRAPDEVAREIVDRAGIATTAGPTRISVRAPSHSYEAIVGRGVSRGIAKWLPPLGDAERAAVVAQPGLDEVVEAVAASLHLVGLDPEIIVVPDGEAAKTVDAATDLWTRLAASGFHRTDLVVGVGGGAVCDLAGFVASTFHRGMQVVLVPTTLLAQADAAIGGKNAVNLDYGKNLVGTFHQPAAVLCDIDLLETLPEPELRSGLAEVAKHGFIAAPHLLDTLETDAEALLKKDPSALQSAVTASLSVKAEVVALDEHEQGPRAHLNYGHTFGHAMEHCSRGALRHGEAVALGMLAAAYAAQELALLHEDGVRRHVDVLETLGLPTRATFDAASLRAVWEKDKKYRHGVRFVLLSAIGQPQAGIEIGSRELDRALMRLSGK